MDQKRVSLWALAVSFFRIGLASFGGLLTTLALIEREFVDRRGVLTKDDITEAVTYTRLLPGSGGPLAVSYMGFKLGGWPASAVATAFLLLPGVLLMLALAVGFIGVSALPGVRSAIGGLLAAVVGVQAVTMVRFARSSVKDRITLAVFIVVFGGALLFDWNAPLLVLLAGLGGALLPGTDPVSAPKA